jgi:hypothetical protein
MGNFRLDSFEPLKVQVAGCFEHRNGPLCSINCSNFVSRRGPIKFSNIVFSKELSSHSSHACYLYYLSRTSLFGLLIIHCEYYKFWCLELYSSLPLSSKHISLHSFYAYAYICLIRVMISVTGKLLHLSHHVIMFRTRFVWWVASHAISDIVLGQCWRKGQRHFWIRLLTALNKLRVITFRQQCFGR